MKFKQILEGFRNNLFPPEHLKEQILKVSSERLNHCIKCDFNSTPGKITSFSRCMSCGCFLTKKAACLSCNCGIEDFNKANNTSVPLKWTAVASVEEDYEIEKALENDTQKH